MAALPLEQSVLGAPTGRRHPPEPRHCRAPPAGVPLRTSRPAQPEVRIARAMQIAKTTASPAITPMMIARIGLTSPAEQHATDTSACSSFSVAWGPTLSGAPNPPRATSSTSPESPQTREAYTYRTVANADNPRTRNLARSSALAALEP
jgi:hypothetical protein